MTDISVPKLHENDKQSCEREITKNECWDVLKSMSNNKAWFPYSRYRSLGVVDGLSESLEYLGHWE